mmetsp:Transcript_16495/g.49125  ORF Transcript_16495/g.49125 Transcript_16495/m.49125 type:complete len:131 (+) Transcript_16495:1376-1768(+)
MATPGWEAAPVRMQEQWAGWSNFNALPAECCFMNLSRSSAMPTTVHGGQQPLHRQAVALERARTALYLDSVWRWSPAVVRVGTHVDTMLMLPYTCLPHCTGCVRVQPHTSAWSACMPPSAIFCDTCKNTA